MAPSRPLICLTGVGAPTGEGQTSPTAETKTAALLVLRNLGLFSGPPSGLDTPPHGPME